MIIDPTQGLSVGHQLGKNENFDTGMLFSMVYQPQDGQQHESPTPMCLFYVAAYGIAQPLTRVVELNGARCKINNDEKIELTIFRLKRHIEI
ncbi:hypothetical protein [Parashewanella tropica]|uniref:hypothetical protein n=1 Tax=Parashewanella tropica TaxID=2547970 RepID=UPI0010593B33|nr:hypothetical protein [Parashewanella tropica]